MPPEPTGGYYVKTSVREFVEKFGYKDKLGRLDRMNFGGIHKAGVRHNTTQLTLTVQGFDLASGKITDTNGCIALIGDDGVDAASWSFTSLLKHWNRKHAKASYVPSKSREEPIRQYSYGNIVLLGTGTDFTLYLRQMLLGNIYYDPGIKLENISTARPTVKRRSQFRIKSLYLPELYRNNEIVDLAGVKA